jgi:hypothetical protein
MEEIISTLLVILFTYAAVSKLIQHDQFTLQLSRSPFITQYSKVISWLLPICEITISIMICIKKTKLIGLYASLFLMTLFTVYIYSMLRYSYYIPCSCGGVLSKMSWTVHFWFNVCFCIFSIVGIVIAELTNHYQSNEVCSI